MTLTQIRASLRLWEAREVFRKRLHAVAQADVDWARAHGLHPRQVLIDRRNLRSEQLEEAREIIARRQSQIIARNSLSSEAARTRVVAQARKAKAAFDRNPSAYHYRAGGIANTIVMEPTPNSYRSDCSQFAVNIYREAGVPCPGSGTFLYSNTDSIANGGLITTAPKPGDLGMYCYSMANPRNSTHHVEIYIGDGHFIGHGTQRIDSTTPGKPNYYLTFIH